MRASLRRYIPKGLIGVYHGMLADLAVRWYRRPTRNLVVIGITGTSGKTTAALLLHSILEQSGHPSAAATTAEFVIRNRRILNDKKMTMLGRFALQKFIRRAARAGCTHVIVETTSEGLAQNRHRGIDYDIAVLTNLTPEHVESHGSFAAYQQAKERLFHVLTLTERKPNVQKSIIVNADCDAAPSFLRHAADRYLTFSLNGAHAQGATAVQLSDIDLTASGSQFTLTYERTSQRVSLKLLGRMNVENAGAAASAALALGIPLDAIAYGLGTVASVPGRLESIAHKGITAIVDYAFHPKAMEELYAVTDQLPHKRIIHVLGATGGGRDRARRPLIGRIASERADIVIITNEDPYDEDPYRIMDDVRRGVMEIGGRIEHQNVFTVYDRMQAITKAVDLARNGDCILVTGKGSEQVIVVANGKKVPFDDREAVRSALNSKG